MRKLLLKIFCLAGLLVSLQAVWEKEYAKSACFTSMVLLLIKLDEKDDQD